MKLFRLTFLFSTVFVCLSFAEIIDKKNVLAPSFVKHWNLTLSDMEKHCGAKINFLISDINIDVSENIPAITVIHKNSLLGFEIYQSNFGSESNFVIPSMFFSEIIPEANKLFNEQKPDQAAEYILINVKEILTYYKTHSDDASFIANEETPRSNAKSDKFEEKIKKYEKNVLLVGLLLSVIVYLCIILLKKQNYTNVNSSYFFGGMSKTNFFGGDFNNIEWSYDRKKE